MRILFVLSLAVVLFTGCYSAVDPGAPPKSSAPVVTESPMPAVALQTRDFEGLMALIKKHQGKVVVMDAWSTSCPPCLKEFPNLVEIHKKHGPEKVACISLNLDFIGIGKPEEVQEPVLGFLMEKGATFDNVLASESDEVMEKKLKIGAPPAVLVYDQKGELAKTFQGAFTYEQVKELVESLVK